MRTYVLLAGLLAATTAGAQKRAPSPSTISPLFGRSSDPQPSPDGKSILYAVRTTDVAANKRTTQTFVVAVRRRRRAAFPSADVSATEARWSPDGKHIAYIAGGQLWVADAERRERAPAHSPERRRHRSRLGADQRSHRLHVGRVSRLHERRVQRGEGQSGVRQQSEGARRRPADVSPLERVGRRHAIASVRRRRSTAARRRIWCLAQSTTFRPDRSAAARATRGRPTGVSSRTRRRTKVAPTRRRPTSTSTRCRRAGGTPAVITAANKGADQNPVYSPDGKFIALRVAGARGLRVGSVALDGLQPRRQDVARAVARRGTATPTHTSGRRT